MDDKVIYIIVAIMILGPIIFIIFTSDNKEKSEKRAKEIAQYAKRNKLSFRQYYSKFIKDYGNLSCFVEMIDPTFCSVIEKLDKENGDLFIGELQWEVAVEKNRKHQTSDAGEGRYYRVKNYSTLCVLYDYGFNLPDFDLSRETLKEKTVEILHINNTEDIDFADDKEFSSAWWLSSNENMVVRELFTKNIRSNFMNFVDKGYRICGNRNVLFIIADKPFCPKDYSILNSDIRMIQRFLKNNKKFYTPYSERQEGIKQLS